MPLSGVNIRPARPEDREAVFRFTQHTWDFGDYIADVWDTWLKETGGKLLVMTFKLQPVALAHLVLVSQTEAWLEGLRVDPDCRRAGLATQLIQYCIKESASMGASILRFITSSQNTPIHLLSDKLGFTRVASLQTYLADSLEGNSEKLSLATARDLPLLLSFVKESSTLKAMDGLYSTGWRFQSLTSSQLEKCIKESRVLAIRQAGNIGALAIIETGHFEDLVIRYTDGQPEILTELAVEIRKLAASRHLSGVSARLPELPPAQSVLRKAGYRPSEDHPFWLYKISPVS